MVSFVRKFWGYREELTSAKLNDLEDRIGTVADAVPATVPDATPTVKGKALLGAADGSATFQRVEDLATQLALIQPDGNVVYGSGPPASNQGKIGDSYVDSSVSPPRLYGPKGSGGVWPDGYVTLGGPAIQDATQTVKGIAKLGGSGGAASYDDVQAALASVASKSALGRRPIATIGLLGASTEQNSGDAYPLSGPYPTVAAANDYGYWSFAAAKLGSSAPRMIRQEGVSGNTSAQILARTPAALSTGAQPDAWVVNPSVNDFPASAGITVEQSIANAYATADQIRAAGRIPIVATGQPHGANARTGMTLSDYRDRMSRVNDALRRYALVNGCLLLDIERILTDALTGEWRANTTADDLHPAKGGAAAIGFALADLLAPYVRTGDDGPCNALDPYDKLAGAGFMPGTVGQTTPPTGWTVSDNKAAYGETRTAAWTQVLEARPDGLGNRFKLTLTSPGAIIAQAYALSSFEGQAFDGQIEIDTNGSFGGAAVYDLGMYLRPYGVVQRATALVHESHAVQDFSASPKRRMPELGKVVLRTPPIQRDSNAALGPYTAMNVVMWGETGASISLSRGRVRQVTT